jgi:hypothetical protein
VAGLPHHRAVAAAPAERPLVVSVHVDNIPPEYRVTYVRRAYLNAVPQDAKGPRTIKIHTWRYKDASVCDTFKRELRLGPGVQIDISEPFARKRNVVRFEDGDQAIEMFRRYLRLKGPAVGSGRPR